MSLEQLRQLEQLAFDYDQAIASRLDAERWRKLIKLVGHPGDGSDTVVRFFWDDATMTPFIEVGSGIHKVRYSFPNGRNFDSIMGLIPEPTE